MRQRPGWQAAFRISHFKMNAVDAIKSTRKELLLGELYNRVAKDKLSEEDRWFLATIIARYHEVDLIFSESHYIDLKKK